MGLGPIVVARFGANPRIEVCGPERLAALPDHSVDLVVMHSVAQYLTAQELDAALVLFRRLLSPTGSLVLGDVIRPTTSALADALALLRFGARHGFFFAALVGLGRTVLSPYLRPGLPLRRTRYTDGRTAARHARGR